MPEDPPPRPHAPSLLRRPGCWITALTGLPLLFGAAYFTENIVGVRQLAHAKADLASAGMSPTADAVKGPPPADTDNFCAIPVLAAIGKGLDPVPGMEPVMVMVDWYNTMTQAGVAVQGPSTPAPTDWEQAYDSLVAAGHIEPGDPDADATLTESGSRDFALTVLAETVETTLGPITAEISGALDRPQAVFKPGYFDVSADSLLHGPWRRAFGPLINLCKVYRFRAALAIDRGDGPTVVESCRIILRLAASNESESPLIAMMVSQTLRSYALEIAWTACARRTLHESDYTRLAQLFNDVRPLNTLPDVLHAEVTSGQICHDWLRRSPSQYLGLIRDPFDPTLPTHWNAGSLFVPPGWFDANLATTHRFTLQLLQRLNDRSRADRFHVSPWIDARTSRGNPFPFHGAILATMPILGKPLDSCGRQHALFRLAAAACALEALAAGPSSYPASLAEIVPSILDAVPQDLDDQPIRYAPDLAVGRYRLWSVGINGTDENGTGATSAGWKSTGGDLVWEHPP